MGTRADFYIKTVDKLEWLGSIAWDGYDIGNVGKSKSLSQYKKRLKTFLDGREDSTYPANGWPWPWNNSKLTDCCYVFTDGQVYHSYDRIGSHDDASTPLLFCPCSFDPFTTNGDVKKRIDGKKKILVPDMSSLKNVRYDRGSGLIILSV